MQVVKFFFIVEEDEYLDEDYLGVYEDYGYMIVYFYWFYGDNIMGGLIIMVVFVFSFNVQREFVIVKDWVFFIQMEEEIEEEVWDVSMVVEYGEEIFVYMRQFEVCIFCSGVCQELWN